MPHQTPREILAALIEGRLPWRILNSRRTRQPCFGLKNARPPKATAADFELCGANCLMNL